MAAVRCPFPGCTYSTPEGMEPAVTAVILSTHALSHSAGAVKAKPAPIKQPDITSGGTTENWSYFVTRWKAYSGAVQLSGQDVIIQLLECCYSKLRRDITRNAVGLEDMTEEGLLEAMRSLAVREENPKVARVALSRMVQDREEPVRAFAARLRGQAEVCWFVKKCTGCDVVSNQGEERVADQLYASCRLADIEIQEDLLKDPNQDMLVEEMIRFIEVRASGKRSAASMTTPTSVNELGDGEGNKVIGSAYRRQQRCSPPRQGPDRTTPTRPKATPLGPTNQREPGYPSPRATSTKGQSPTLV